MISLGMPNKLIANKLFITEKTVKTHANHVYRKLGVTSRLQATWSFRVTIERARRSGRPGGADEGGRQEMSERPSRVGRGRPILDGRLVRTRGRKEFASVPTAGAPRVSRSR